MKQKFHFLVMLLSLAVVIAGCGKKDEKEAKKEEEVVETKCFNVDDLVINPAGTNGQRVIMVSVALEVKSDEEVKTLEERKALVQDIVNNSISNKTIETLTQTGYKDSLKTELKKAFKSRLPKTPVRDVYFTKYIIQ